MNRKPLLGFLRYGVLYAGLTVLAVRFVTTAELPFMAMFIGSRTPGVRHRYR